MKLPVPKEEITVWLEAELVEKIRTRAKRLNLKFESLLEDALFEIFDKEGLSRVYGDEVPPPIKYRSLSDKDRFKREQKAKRKKQKNRISRE